METSAVNNSSEVLKKTRCVNETQMPPYEANSKGAIIVESWSNITEKNLGTNRKAYEI
jgi:hypothetical protein